MTNRNRGLGADLLGTSRPRRTLQGSEELGADVGTPMKNAHYVPTDHLEPDPQQPRKQWDEDSEKAQQMIESVQTYGVLQPITVTEAEGRQGYFIIVFGERRWQAARAAGLPQVPVIIVPPLTEDERQVRQLEENTQRADLRPSETLETLARLLARKGREWVRKHGWQREARLSRWAAVAENRELPLGDDPQDIIDLWALADEKGITAAYDMIVARRQAERQERGRTRMGRPAKEASAPVSPGAPAALAPAGATPAIGDYSTADGAGEDEHWQEDASPSAPSGRTPARSAPGPAAAGGGRSGAPAAPRPAAGGAYAGGQDLGVISVDGSLYTVDAARNLVARIQDSPDFDVLDQLLKHGEYQRWIGRAGAGDVQGWESDLRGLADWFEQRARAIRALIGENTQGAR
jgi:ParB family chromosome partitioning protein